MPNMFQEMTLDAIETAETSDDFKRVIPVALLNVRIQYRTVRLAKMKQKIRKLETKQTKDHTRFAAKLFRYRMKF
jgi:hypothetical protein